ncbi:hypothetical protein [Winogradskyella haliclonae]|uniref:TonB C-terminal domain-containing protein n=1 Tax=Winogradskyella haliclonae TaxID=2048558 RepID=A0ABQ2BXM3_9FLAO|nr:hypothetical protein [Winogradskyella haliclonae]GGI56641.1 hypothetical protein GCM10011444_09500 [Winogradskyella haliclonae]
MNKRFIIALLFIGLNSFGQNGKTLKELDSITKNEADAFPILAKSIKFPVYKGCHKIEDDEEAKKCSIKKIKDFISLSFDYDIADKALPKEKSTQFELNFKVNKRGKVEGVTAKANHKAIAIEAIRTAKRIPKFKSSGMLNGSPIDTPMTITMIIYF